MRAPAVRRSRHRPGSRRDERGSITPFVVIVSLVVILLAGLVIDGGRQLNAKGRAIAYAQEAARAGAQAIDVSDPRLDLVPQLARAAADAYCDQAQAADDQLVQCSADITTVHVEAGDFRAVRVTTRVSVEAILLGIINRHVLNATGRALARPVSGISEPDSGKQLTVPPPTVGLPPEGPPPSTAPPEIPEISVSPCTTVEPSPTKKSTGPGKKGDKDDKDDKGKKGKEGKEDEETSKPSPTHSPCVTLPGGG